MTGSPAGEYAAVGAEHNDVRLIVMGLGDTAAGLGAEPGSVVDLVLCPAVPMLAMPSTAHADA